MRTTKKRSRALQRHILCCLLSAATAALSISAARGELLFSDSFDYPAGPLAGQGPPAGAPPGQTGWTLVSGKPEVIPPGLHFPRVFSAGVGAGVMHQQVDNTVTANLTPVSSGIVWIGFLFEQVGGPGSVFGFAVLNLSAQDGNPPTGYGVLFVSDRFGIDNDFGGQRVVTDIAPGHRPAWLVVKLNFDTGRQDLFVNPTDATATPDASLAMTPTFRASGFSQVWLHEGLNDRGSAFVFDELRVGRTFADIRVGE